MDAPEGRSELAFVFEKTGLLAGHGWLEIDGRKVAQGTFDDTLIRLSLAPLRIGSISLPPVDPERETGHDFQGVIEKVVYRIGSDREQVPETLDVD